MKAIVYDRYGPPDGLRLVELPVPAPAPRQVLVRVAAVSLNLSDWERLQGKPLYARRGGLRRPSRSTLGSDISGWVEAVGDEVTEFAPGDEVYGDNLGLEGGFADYALAPKPPGLSFVESSTIPRAGAHVTGVDNTEKLDFMRSLGADEVVDYTAKTSPAETSRHGVVVSATTTCSTWSRVDRCAPV